MLVCPSECSVLLLDPRRYRLKSSSSGIGSSFRVLHPLKYRPYWFCDPAWPLAPYLGCAVFLQQAAAGDCLGYRLHPLFELALPLEFYPATPTRLPPQSGPLMGFGSLQHLKDSRSTGRGPSLPATFRLQGLATLLTVFALESRAGSVSHRQRSWDSPFGGFLSQKVVAVFRPERTRVPFSPAVFPAPKRQTGPPSLGFRVHAFRDCLVNARSFNPALTGASLGFCPSRACWRGP
jgi:hypothetical protein